MCTRPDVHALADSTGLARTPVRRRGPLCQPWSPDSRCAAHAATWARELNPSLMKILATCLAAVAGLITSSSAMPRLDRPRAIRAAISRSRAVSLDGAPELSGPAAPQERLPGSQAELRALRQAGPGQLQVALGQRPPPDAGQAPGDLGPGVDLAVQGQRVPEMGQCRLVITARLGETAEPVQRLRHAPAVVVA